MNFAKITTVMFAASYLLSCPCTFADTEASSEASSESGSFPAPVTTRNLPNPDNKPDAPSTSTRSAVSHQSTVTKTTTTKPVVPKVKTRTYRHTSVTRTTRR